MSLRREWARRLATSSHLRPVSRGSPETRNPLHAILLKDNTTALLLKPICVGAVRWTSKNTRPRCGRRNLRCHLDLITILDEILKIRYARNLRIARNLRVTRKHRVVSSEVHLCNLFGWGAAFNFFTTIKKAEKVIYFLDFFSLILPPAAIIAASFCSFNFFFLLHHAQNSLVPYSGMGPISDSWIGKSFTFCLATFSAN